jgi:pimeloyl-ACP methyl ester carboxylesterase
MTIEGNSPTGHADRGSPSEAREEEDEASPSPADTRQYSDLPSRDLVSILARQLSLPISLPLRPRDAAFLEGADIRAFGPGFGRIAWWMGEGPLVVLIHGWGGRASQMAPLAARIAAAGHRCVLFDAGGHGSSRADPIGFDTFIDDVASLCEVAVETPYALIGHSAGALGMMASRRLRGVRAGRYVCVAAPLYPYVPIETLKGRFPIDEAVAAGLERILASQFLTSWDQLMNGSAYGSEPDARLLLVNDEDDERVRHTDADFIAARWPGAQILKTRGLGHNRVLADALVWDRILEHLKS